MNVIRPFTIADAERLKELTILAFDGVSIDQNIERAFGVIGGRDWKFRKARHIDFDIAAHPSGIFVYELDGQVVGFITTRIDHETKIGWIPNIVVHPEYQGRGIGKALMQRALEHLREQGMECVKIETLEQNRIASQWYPRLGFREVARQIHYVMKL